MNKSKFYIFSILLISLISIIGLALSQGNRIGVFSSDENIFKTETSENVSIQNEHVTKEIYDAKDIEIKIGAVGDIMVHGPQLRAQYDSKAKQYSFENNFAFVKPYIENLDLALANLETTLAGIEQKYSSYPRFNSPDDVVETLKNTGFDILSIINNHTMDRKKQGYIRTLQVLKNKNIDYIGGKTQTTQDNFLIKDVKGIKVGLISYSYETKKVNGQKTLNGITVDKEIEELINTFNYEKLDQDLDKMKIQIQLMKEKGADAIIFYIHWGEEYKREANKNQQKIAQFLADEEVDIIFGSHPHVVQPIKFVKSKNSDKQTLVIYSLGNFLSNQRQELMGTRYTEDGIIVQVTLQKRIKDNEDGQTKKVYIKDVKYIPTWVNRYKQKGKTHYEIVPLVDIEESKYNLGQSGNLNRALMSKQNTETLINLNYTEVVK